MTVEANIITAKRDNAVLVASAGVVDGAVWIDEGGRARKRNVTIGAQGAQFTEIVSGVHAGDKVIVSAPLGLKDGRRISVRAADGLGR